MSHCPTPSFIPPLQDAHGRIVSYLRLSVTDRCNLRCHYCASCQELKFLSHDAILRYEELLHLVDLAVGVGVAKVRLTGGEPFARRDFLTLVRSILERQPQLDLRITTNGTLLEGKIGQLQAAGVRCLNISLDTLQPAVFARITGQDLHGRVMAAMHQALEAGIRVKLNAVAMRGINDGELPAFLDLARRLPVDVRFIEFMPMGGSTLWREENFWSAEDILAQANHYATLVPVERGDQRHGPARMFVIEGGAGRFGLITPLSNHFCGSCNRLRITSDGCLRPCLFSDREYRLRPLLRHPKLGLAAVAKVLRLAGSRKPLGHEILAARRRCAVAEKRMSSIGG